MNTAGALWHRKTIYVIDWESFGRCLTALCNQIADSPFRPATVVAIARGGIAPALYLANAFGCTDFRIIAISRTITDQLYSTKQEPKYEWMSSARTFEKPSVLLVDDIVGAGATLALALQVLASQGAVNVRTAAVVKNCNCSPQPNYCPATVDDWVVFPWEAPASGSAFRLVPLESECELKS